MAPNPAENQPENEARNGVTNERVVALKAHIAIEVRDVARSIDFYRRLFGLDPVKVRTGYAKFDLQNPPLNFTLNETPRAGSGALSHLGIQLASTHDVVALRERWKSAGLDTRDERKTECCYALQDKTWVRDPDGNEWETFVVLKDHLPERAAAPHNGARQSADAPDCCEPTCCAPRVPSCCS